MIHICTYPYESNTDVYKTPKYILAGIYINDKNITVLILYWVNCKKKDKNAGIKKMH